MAPGIVTATCAQLETELRRQGVSQFSSVLTGALTFDAAASAVSFPLAHNDLGDRVAVALAEAIRAVVMKHSDASAAMGDHRSGRTTKSSTTSFANVSWILDLRGNSLTDAICGTFLLLLSSIEKVDLDLRSNPKISATGIAQFQATGTVFRGSIKLDPVLVSTLDSTTESSSLPGLNRGPRGAVPRGRGVAPPAAVSVAGAAPAAAKPRHNAFGSSDDSDSDDGLALPGHRARPPAATAAAHTAGAQTSRSQPAPAARAATADASGATPPSQARNRNAFSDDDDDDDDLGLPGERPTPGRPANTNVNATAIEGAGAGRKTSEGHHATTPEGIIGMRQNRDRLFAKESVSPGSHHAHDDDDDDDGLQFAPEGRNRGNGPPNSNESKRQSHHHDKSGAAVSRGGGGGRRFSTDVAAANEFVKDSFTSASQDHATSKGSTSTAPKGKSAEKKTATAGKQKDDAKAKGGRPRRAGLVSTSSDDDTSSFDHNAPPAARSAKSKTTAREGKKNDRDGDGGGQDDDDESSSGSSFGVPNRARRAVDHAALNLSPLTSESPSPARGAAGRHGAQGGRGEAQAGGGGRHRGAEPSATDKQSGTRKGGIDRHNADGGSPTGCFQRTVDFEEGSDDDDAGSQHRNGHHKSANPKSGGGGVGQSAAASTDLSQTGDSLEGSPIAAAGRNSGGARGSHGARDGDSDGDDGAGVGDHGDSTIEELQAVADDVATAVTERPDEQDELDITLNRSEYDVCCSLFLSGFAPDVLFEKIARDNAAQNLTILNIAQNRLESLPVLPRTLQRLDASNNMLTQIHGLHACPSLVVLNLRRNLLTRIEGLGACRLLGHLFLGRNALSEIDNIAHLSHLETLDVGFNRLSRPQDIRPLSMNKHLAHIIVEGNPLIENEVAKFLRGKKKAAARRKEVDSGASTAFSSFLIGGSSLAPARGNASGMASASGVVDVSKASRGAISRIGELCGTSSSFASSSASPIPKNGRGGRDRSGKTKAGGQDDSVSSAGGLSSVTNMSAVEDKVTRTMLRQLLPQLMAINNQRVVSITKGAGMMRSSSAGFALGRPGTRSGSLYGAGVASGRSPSDATLFQSMLQDTADRSARARPGTAAGNQSVTSGAGGGSRGGGQIGDDSFVNATGLVRQFTPTVGYSARSHTARSIRAIQSEHTRRELRENPRLRNISRLVRNEFKEEWRDADAGGGVGGGGGELSSGGAEGGGGDGGDQPTGFITSGMEDSKHSLTQRYVDATITNDLVASANVSAARSGRTSTNAHDQPSSAATGAGGQQNAQPSINHHHGQTDLGQQQAHGSIGVDVGGVGAGAGGPAVVVPPLDIRLSQAHAAASSSATAHQASPHQQNYGQALHHQAQQGQQQQRQGGQGYPNQQAGGGGQPQGYPQSNPQPMQSPRRVIYPPSSHETRDFAATSDMRLPLQQLAGGGPQGQPIGLPPQHRRQPSDRRLAPPGFSHTFDMDQIDGGGQGVGGAPRQVQGQSQGQGQGQGSQAYFLQGRRPVLSPTRADETKHLSPPRDTSAAAPQADHQHEHQRGREQGLAGYAQQHQQQAAATAAEALLLAGSHGQRSLTGAPHRLSVSHFGSSLAGQASNPNHSSANLNVHVNPAASGNDGFTTPRQMPPQRTEDLAELALRHLAETPPHQRDLPQHQQRVDVRSDLDLSPRQNSDRRTGRGGGGGGSAPSPSVFSASALRSNSASGSGPVPGTARTNTNLSSGGVAGDALSFDSSNGDGTGGLTGGGPHRRLDANAIPPVYTRDAPIGASTDVDAARNHDGWGPTTRTGTQPPQEEGLNSGGGGNGGGGGGRGLLQRSASASRQSKGARAASDASGSGRPGSKNDEKSEGIVAAPPMVTTWLSALLVDEQAVSRGLETFVKVLRPMLTEREQQKENAAMVAAGLPPRYPDVPPPSRQNPSASLAETLPPDAIQCLEIILSADMLEDLDIPVAVRDFFAFSTAELVGDPSVVLPSERRAMPRARMAEIAGRGAAPPKGSVLRVVRRLGETRTFLRTVLALLQDSRADAFWQCIAPVRNFTA